MDLLVNIDVPNVNKAVAFYAQAIGLYPARRLFNGAVVEMLGAHTPIYLISKDAGTCPAPHVGATRDYVRHWTPVHVDFIVDDIERAVTKAIEAGATVEGMTGALPWRSFAWGHLATFSDPFGNGFCLVQWLGGGYDEVASPRDMVTNDEADAPDGDLLALSREALIDEVKKLRAGIRTHRDSSGHDLCWHHPALWALLPEKTDPQPVVPAWPQFMQGCIRYRQSLDAQLPDAPRKDLPFED